MAGGRDPTRPEYVVSDMLRPLPELDLDFVSFDPAHEAVGPVRSDDKSKLSYTEAAGRSQEADTPGRVLISSDDSLSSGSETSPGGGGYRKRHNVSPPFRRRVDKKLFQIQRGRGRGLLSNTTTHSPPRDPSIIPPVDVDLSQFVRAYSPPRDEAATSIIPPVDVDLSQSWTTHSPPRDTSIIPPVDVDLSQCVRAYSPPRDVLSDAMTAEVGASVFDDKCSAVDCRPFNTRHSRPLSAGRGILRGARSTDRPAAVFPQCAMCLGRSHRLSECRNVVASRDADCRDNASRQRRRREMQRMRSDLLLFVDSFFE